MVARKIRIGVAWSLLGTAILGLTVASGPLLVAQTRKKPPKADVVAPGPAYGFQDVVDGQAVLPPGRLAKLIEVRGVSFYPTDAQEEQLKTAGVDADVIALIKKKGAGYKPVAPPKPTTAGPILLTCAPAECSVEFDGKPDGQTKDGKKRLENRPIGSSGKLVVDFKKEGYIGQQLIIPLQANVVVNKSVTLAPTPASLEKFGHDILQSVMAKLGNKEDAGMLRSEGSVNIFPPGGQPTQWTVEARLNAAGSMAYLEINGAGLKWWTSLRGQSDSKSGGSGKLKGSPVAIEMEKVTSEYRDYQPVILLSKIINQKMKLSSESVAVDPANGATVTAVGNTEKYTLTIGASGLLDRVLYESASGLAPQLSAIYGGYAAAGRAKVPKVIQFRFADKAQNGTEFHFEKIQTDPKLNDREFRR